jgi:hypothetical protein
MPLNAQLDEITAPGATGVQTYSLPANFNPRLVIMFAAYHTAAGLTAPGNGIMAVGFGTFDGGAVQQWSSNCFMATGLASSDDQNGHGNTVILQAGPTTCATAIAGSTTLDYQIALSSLTDGTSSSYALNWIDLPATASLKFFALVLGGDAIDRARVSTFQAVAAETFRTISFPAGWGQPTGGLFLGVPWTGTIAGIQNAEDAALCFGAGNTASQTDAYSVLFHDNKAATMDVAAWGATARTLLVGGGTNVQDAEYQFSTLANFPADGFRMDCPDPTTFAFGAGVLAWTGSMLMDINKVSAPTSTGASTVLGTPGTTARAALFASALCPTTVGMNLTDAALGGFMFGALAGTSQGVVSVGQDDGNASSACWRDHGNTSAVRMIQPNVTATLAAEATATLNGPDVALNWTSADATAREMMAVIFSDGFPADIPVPIFHALPFMR